MRILVIVNVLVVAAVAGGHAQVPRVAGHAPGAGVSLYYEIVGAGPDTAMFLHGTPSTMYSLARDFDELATDLTLIFFDQRGGGRSQLVLDPDSLRWQDHVADIEALRAHLRISRMHVVGVSWGSALAVLYARRYPARVDRIVLFPMRARRNPDVPANPGPVAPSPDTAQLRRANELINAWPTAPDPDAVCNEYWDLILPFMFANPDNISDLQGSFCDEPAEVLRRTWTVSNARMRSLGDFDLRPVLKEITAPTLLVKGITRMYRAWTEEWAQALPDARLLWLHDSGSLPWIERPDVTFPAIREFLAGSWPAASETVR